jgi:hypothetical protein
MVTSVTFLVVSLDDEEEPPHAASARLSTTAAAPNFTQRRETA